MPSDHPRSRGEYLICLVDFGHNLGSSPLSRGIRSFSATAQPHSRIIPALAGNTQQPGIRSFLIGDHPRSRGEYAGVPRCSHRPSGSSPLSRGILGGEHGGAGQPRIIPALAGNTSPAHRAKNPCRDHPRSRGEYDAEQVGDVGGEGSSPLSRGIPTNTTDRAVSARIIPALAGNTPSRDAATDFDADHPRSRGEYDSVFPAGAAGLGSSPLSRGIPYGRILDL